MIKNRRELIYICIIVLLGIFLYGTINSKKNAKQDYKNLENTITALSDSITKKVNENNVQYSKLSPEIYLDKLINSAYFNTLSNDQKRFYNELNEMKRVLVATEAELRAQKTLLAQIDSDDNPGVFMDDSIKFELGTELTFNEEDTTKNLQWNSTVTLDSIIDFKFDYDYNFKINTVFNRQKDKSILVTYTIDDPDLTVGKINNFIIPPKQRKTKFGQWIDKNQKTFKIIGGVAIFAGGAYVGHIITK